MDNQKSNEGSARDTGREGSGSSMGKDQGSGRNEGKGSTGAGSTASPATSTSTGAVGGTSNAGTTTGSSAAGSSGSTSGAGSSSMSGAGSSGSMGGSSGAMGSSGNSGTSQDTGKGGLASAVTSAVNPQELHKTIDKAAQAAQPVMDRLATSAHAGVDKVTNMLSGASVSMGQRQQQLTDASQKLMDSTREYVREKPGTAIAIAAAAGFILAKLLGGSNRRDY